MGCRHYLNQCWNIVNWIIRNWANFSEILILIYAFPFKKMYFNVSFAKWRPLCLGLSVLKSSISWCFLGDLCQYHWSVDTQHGKFEWPRTWRWFCWRVWTLVTMQRRWTNLPVTASTKYAAQVVAVISWIACISARVVKESVTTWIYSFPLWLNGSGPIISIPRRCDPL